MATIQLITPNKTTTYNPTAPVAVELLNGYAKANNYNGLKLVNETKEEFFHRIVFSQAFDEAERGSLMIAREEQAPVVPKFKKSNIT